MDDSLEVRAVTIQCGDCRIALYQGYGEENFLNFRGGDVYALAGQFKLPGLALEREPETGLDGATGGPLVRDPDGNAIYFCHYPNEERKT